MAEQNEKQAFAALNAPVADTSWTLEAELLGTVAETGDVPVRFTRPIEIVGIHVSVITKLPMASPALREPTVKDINVSMLSNDSDTWTKRLTESGSGGNFALLESLGIQVPRLMRLRPGGDTPDFTFNFAWKQFDAATPYYEGAIISLTLYANYLTPKEA